MIGWASPSLGKEEFDAIARVVASNRFTQGEEVSKLEEELAAYIGCKYAVCVSSGTMALTLAYLCIVNELSTMQAVRAYIPSTTFCATANVPVTLNIPIELMPINYDNCLVSNVSFVANRINPTVRIYSPVHLLGQIVPITKPVCNDVYIIEDACQAFGSISKDGMVGSNSDLCCFSFHMAKVLSTIEGGCITTNNEDY
jgi:perosamine synthetase